LASGEPGSDYSRRVVAYIFGNRAITREELGEYLIERIGAERLEFLVNRRIIEMACAQRNIVITDAEIQAQLGEDLKGFNCTERQFVTDILRRYNKTLFEWKEDVIRPKLALQRLVQDRISVSDEDMAKGFEAKFGDKVECRIIVLTKEQGKDRFNVWERVSNKEKPEEFDRVARTQSIAPLAAEGGKIPPIHHYFGDPNLDREAFKLNPGEVSPLIGMPDGTFVILQCVRKVPRDSTKSMAHERDGLRQELTEVRLAQELPKVFKMLRDEAKPQIFLKREVLSSDGIQTAQQPGLHMPQMQPAQGSPPAAPALQTGLPVGSPPQGN
jgi:hypothetical protein